MTEQPDFIQQYSTEVQELVQEARSLVLQTYPGVCEQVDVPSKLFAYGYGSRMKEMLCVIMPVKQGLNLGFYGGVDLPDPAGLLQGTGKRHRHVRIQSSAELHALAVLDLLAAALQAWQARNPQGAPR